MKKILLITLACLFIVGCEDDESSSNNENLAQPSLAQISKTWDLTETDEFGEDVVYLVVKDHGEFIIYDYDGDSWDEGDECYYKLTSTITDLGDGSFEIAACEDYYPVVDMSISEGRLAISDEEGAYSYPEATLEESEFVPLCDEFTLDFNSLRDAAQKSFPIVNMR